MAWPIALSVLHRPATSKVEEEDLGRTLSALNATVIDWQLAYERKPARRREYPCLALDAGEHDLEESSLTRRQTVAA